MIYISALVLLFFFAVGSQLVFYTLFVVAFSRKRKNPSHNHLPVSVVICARNEEVNLQRLIPALKAQDHPSFEIIIVNDRSQDNTKHMVETEVKNDDRIRLINIEAVPESMNPKKYGLSKGIMNARHEIILLTDADCWPRSNRWISAMSDEFSDEIQIVLGYSPYQKDKGLLNLFVRFDTFMTGLQYLSIALLGRPYMGVGRNLAYRKSLFIKKDGFNSIKEITGGDDDLFVNRHATKENTRVSISKDAQVYSVPETTWSSFFQQKTRHLSVGKYYKKQHKIILGIFMASFVVSWIIGMVLIFYLPLSYPIIPALLLRLMMVQINIHLISSRLGDKFNFWQVFFLDFLYAFYYLSTGLRAMLTRNIKWTN